MAALVSASQAVLAGVWAFRTRSEREATVRFERLAVELERHHAAAPVLALAHRAADDERRHVAICARMAARYGHVVQAGGPPAAAPIGPTRLAPRDRLLYEVVAFCAITESINAALMTVTHWTASDADSRAAVREILKDEVGHSRLGWAHLAAERAAGRGDFLAACLPAMLAGAASEGLFEPALAWPHDPALLAHGELALSTRQQIFDRTLHEVIFPGLEQQGIDTAAGRAWYEGVRRDPAGLPTRT